MLSVKTRRKCAKCGHSSKDSNRSFHRFPKPDGRNIERARKWAVWAYPNENWDDKAALEALHKKSRVICSAHFKTDCFTEHAGRHLHLHAFPEDIDDCLGNEDLTSQTLEITPGNASESIQPVPQTSISGNTAQVSTHFLEPLCTPSIKNLFTL